MLDYLNLHTAAAFLNGISLGAMLFFAAVVTPVAFRALEAEARGAFLQEIFPLYFRSLAVLETLAGVFIIYRPEGWILLAVAAGFVFADQVLRPQIDKHRAGRYKGETEATKKFRQWHRLSVGINLLQMLVCLVLFFRLAV